MINFLQETKEAIALSGHTEVDIVFIGSQKTGHQRTWPEFCILADVRYDNGFGAAKVAQDLTIVFSDGQQLYRGEYDGSEWWEFARPFARPADALPLTRLLCRDEQVGWVDLAECNEVEPESLSGRPPPNDLAHDAVLSSTTPHAVSRMHNA